MINQLNCTVGNIVKINEAKTDVLTLVYEAEFSNEGKKISTFLFNDKNQLKQLDLINLEIKTVANEQLNIFKNDENYFTIPFKRVGNLISIEVKLNGINR